MKAAIKFIMTVTGLLLIAATIGTVLLLTQFEGLLRTGITRQAEQILQGDVHLEAVRIDWSRQALELRGISVFNPKGYLDREALRIGSAWVRPQWLTIFSRTPVIAQVVIREARIQLQYDEGLGTNLGAMMAHTQTFAEGQKRGEEWILGRPVTIREILCDPVELQVESIDPPQPPVSLTMNAFSIAPPAGEKAISGTEAIHLVLQGMAKQLGAIDGVVNFVKETVALEADPAAPGTVLP